MPWKILPENASRTTRAKHDFGYRQITETALQDSEAKAKLLLGESQNRVRHLLAVIRLIMRHPADGGSNVTDYLMILEGRIDALARAHTLIAIDGDHSADFEYLITEELRSFGRDSDAVSVSGPKLRLRPKAAELMALAIHELSSNATKQGARTWQQGKIELRWTIDRDGEFPCVAFTWLEKGGPISAKMARRGFAMELIDRTLVQQLGARTSVDITDDSFICRIDLPLDERTFQSN